MMSLPRVSLCRQSRKQYLLVVGQHLESRYTVNQCVYRIASHERPREANRCFYNLYSKLPHVTIEEHATFDLCDTVVARDFLPCKTARSYCCQEAAETMCRECVAVVHPPPSSRKTGELDPQRLTTEQRANDAEAHR